MKAVISSATLQGIIKALELSEKGHDVTILSNDFTLGHDILGKFKFYSAKKEHESLLPWSTSALQRDFYNKANKSNEIPLFANQANKALLEKLVEAGIRVLFATNLVGVSVKDGIVSGALVSNIEGLFEIKADKFIDSSINNLSTHYIAKDAAVIPKNAKVSLTLEYFDMDFAEPLGAALPVTVHAGALKEGHGYVEIEKNFDEDILFEAAHVKMRLYAIEMIKRLSREGMFGSASVSHIAPWIDAKTYPCKKPSIDSYEIIPCANSSVSDTFAPIGDLMVFGNKDYRCSGEKDDTSPSCMKKIALNKSAYKKFNEKRSSVMVAGAGTAGIQAIFEIAENGVDVCFAEAMWDAGGTRTLGGVNGYYFGARHAFNGALVNEITRFSAKLYSKREGRLSPVAESLYYLDKLESRNIRGDFRTSVFGAGAEDGKISLLLAVNPFKAVMYAADIYVDATGNAEVVEYAGGRTFYGDSQLQCPQSASQWQREAGMGKGGKYRIMYDQDVIDNRYYSEINRMAKSNILNCAGDMLRPMITVRESRRIDSKRNVSIADAISGRYYKDTIYKAASDYDPHALSYTDAGRMGFMPKHIHPLSAYIPFRSLLPKNLSNVVVVGKAIGADQEVLNIIRMNSDIQAVGFAAGRIISWAVKENTELDKIDIYGRRGCFIRQGLIPFSWDDIPPKPALDGNTVLGGLIGGDENALSHCVICDIKKILPKLKKAYERGLCDDELLALRALMFFGDHTGKQILISKLIELDKKHGRMVNDAFHVSKSGNVINGYYDEISDYWLMNQIVFLLSKENIREAEGAIDSFMGNTVSGGIPENDDNHYIHGRLDHQIVPNYDRVFTICRAAELMPSPAYADNLTKLMHDENLCGYTTYSETEFNTNFYMGLLELRLAYAAALCGAGDGAGVIERYTKDVHVTLRRFAGEMLPRVL